MLRQLFKLLQRKRFPVTLNKRNFLTNDYKCYEIWKNVNTTPLIHKLNLNDFYNQLEQNYSSKGIISAIDVDVFAHALNDPVHLEELKELLHRLRLSAETGNMLESTHHATIRNFIAFGYIQELVEILKQPLSFGVFLDDFTANILLDETLKSHNYDLAAKTAALIMLQEEFTNELTCALCQYAAYKYIINYSPPEPAPPEDPKKKVEEIKIRVKFLRNPYFDDHFDITDTITLSGKTLAWISELHSDNLNNNLQLIGWLIYKKYDSLLKLCEKLSYSGTFKLYKETLEILEKEKLRVDDTVNDTLKKIHTVLSQFQQETVPIEDSLKTAIENAINKVQNRDINTQGQLFKTWVSIKEQKLKEQAERLDRAKRIQLIQQKQKEMEEEEQKLWFFENEDKIDLEIEEKEKLIETSPINKKSSNASDDYIPPEIRPKSNKL